MNARYRSIGPSDFPNYSRIEDVIQGQHHLGRLLPKNTERRNILDFWLCQPHPAFAKIFRYLDWDGHYLAVLPELSGFQPLAKGSATKLKPTVVAEIFLKLIAACRWLSYHQLHHAWLNLNQIMITPRGGVQLLGHEAAYWQQTIMKSDTVPHLDIRYAAPEVIAKHLPSEKSEVFQLGALFYHFLAGKPYRYQSGLADIRASNRKLKKSWDDVLGHMLAGDPSERPTWAMLWDMVKVEFVDHASSLSTVCPQWQPQDSAGWYEALERELSETKHGPRAVSCVSCEGSRGRHRFERFARTAEKKGYLVVHTWRDQPVERAYQTINEVISLVKLGFLQHIDRPDLEEAFLPLSEWQSAGDLKKRWRDTLGHLVGSMVPGLYRGIVLILEDFHLIDSVSLETLVTFSAWMAPTPFLLALSGPSLSHPHFRQFNEQWQYPLTSLSFSKPTAEEVVSWHASHGANGLELKQATQALALVGGQAAPYMLWLKDRNMKGGLSQWYSQVWQWLKPKEQLVLKMLSCSQRPLAIDEMEAAFGINQLKKYVAHLVASAFLESMETGFCVSAPACSIWVNQQLTESDRQHSLQALLRFEQQQATPDLVQMAYLGNGLNRMDLVEQVLSPVIPRFFEAFSTVTVWRLDELYRRTKAACFEIFHLIGQCLRWQPASLGSFSKIYPNLAQMQKVQTQIASGHLRKARKTLEAFAGKRQLPAGLKAWVFTQLVECAVELGDELTVSKQWRQWMKFDKAAIEAEATDFFTTRMAIAMVKMGLHTRSLEQALAGLPDHLRRLVESYRSWKKGFSEEAAAQLEGVLDQLPSNTDPIWLGRIHQFRGNIIYKKYRPAEAIRNYRLAKQIFSQAQFEPGCQAISFNLASAEKLAGRFSASVARFMPLLEQAEQDGDRKTQSQIMFNLMVCALYQNDLPLFDRWAEKHRRLTSLRNDPEESIRRVAAWLQTALMRSKDEVLEQLEIMDRLVKKATLDTVTRHEVEVSKRWAAFALGKASEPPQRPYFNMTAWRHQFLDALTGIDGPQFPGLWQTIGKGFLGACHFYLLSTAITKSLIPEAGVDKTLLHAFQNHASETGANYSGFLNRHFAHLRGLGDVPPEAWRRAMQVLGGIQWEHAKPDAVEQHLVTALHSDWQFSDRGACEFIKKRWLALDESSSNTLNHWVSDLLNLLKVETAKEPFTTHFAHPESLEVRAVLVLPLAHIGGQPKVLWFMASAKQGTIGLRYEPLFKFYGKLFEWVHYQRQCHASNQPNSQKGAREAKTTQMQWNLVGQSGRMMEVKEKILQFAPSNLNVFIFGESGTGKELVATAFHKASMRSNRPFRAINCAHYPDNLVEEHLFGHVRGAYTGASMERAGVLEQVDGGTLFLDEIGDINPKVQSLLLRVIQEGEFSRVGESRIRKVDIRFITATNKNLHSLIDQGLFREDLFFRLVEEQLELPPLCRRFEDLPLLVNHFVKKHHPHRSARFTKGFYEHLRSYRWPGNVRELESYVRKLLVRWSREEVFSELNSLDFLRGHKQKVHKEETLEGFTKQVRSQFIMDRLNVFGWNRTRTAESLAISRQQLSNLISKYRLRRDPSKQ